jgi:hypothetical protein
MLIVGVLLATVLLRFMLIVIAVYYLLPRGTRCPTCQTEMLPIRHPLLDRLCPVLQRRWCLECGWNGVVRREPPAPHERAPRRRPSRPLSRV